MASIVLEAVSLAFPDILTVERKSTTTKETIQQQKEWLKDGTISARRERSVRVRKAWSTEVGLKRKVIRKMKSQMMREKM